MSDSLATANQTLTPTSALSVEEVLSVHHWNEHLFSFKITRPASLRFRSGEFVMIGLQGDNGRPLLRAYSIASPAYAEELEFLSIKVQDGPLTSRLQKIQPGDHIYLGKKPTGTLVADALLPGKRLFLLSTGTGLAPFLSVVRDPEIYDRFDQVVVVHGVRHVNELAYRELLESNLEGDPLLDDDQRARFHYIPTVTREDFHTTGRIPVLIDNGTIFKHPLGDGAPHFDPATDRIMMCGSMAMIKELEAKFLDMGFIEGSNASPGQFVIERAFVD
ncbi:ferredoxin--NADP(+) reductase [Sphingobium jiangsuense]|uniref:ferredoxin--NADP(+) reductase n=1 Tax=Sphingobium jiangsuense TaxID=870476 RepID=A0A7W6FRW4_9SPHN|nr:ferredoxin--NADP reductase [Sphingobium jiangsuense]MBB3928423.1 ferredoxin--NADP+ reductase [Sphingobium jiangsuense]GLT02432.1 ferredoxin--NADP(+) reductase [Sphingobium jiangsuense]